MFVRFTHCKLKNMFSDVNYLRSWHEKLCTVNSFKLAAKEVVLFFRLTVLVYSWAHFNCAQQRIGVRKASHFWEWRIISCVLFPPFDPIFQKSQPCVWNSYSVSRLFCLSFFFSQSTLFLC